MEVVNCLELTVYGIDKSLQTDIHYFGNMFRY